MAITSLPPGFRFHPTDVELVKYYLKRKVLGRRIPIKAIAEVDVYKFAPWDLPDKACLRSRDRKWYFFCPRQRKYATGARTNRSTDYGFWKTTGRDKTVIYNGQTVGMRRSLVFHISKTERTDWVMHEYRLEDEELKTRGVEQDAFVLCEIYEKDGCGPRNGAQYGAPFNEDEWDDEGGDDVSPASAFTQEFILPNMRNIDPERFCVGSTSKACPAGPSQIIPSVVNVPPLAPPNDITMEDPQNPCLRSHGIFADDIPAAPSEKDRVENPDSINPNGDRRAEYTTDDIFKELEDLPNVFPPGETFMELNDFDDPLTSADGPGLSGHNHSEGYTSAFGRPIATQSLCTPAVPYHDNDPGLALNDLDIPITCGSEAGQSNEVCVDASFSDRGSNDGLVGSGTISNPPVFAQPFHGPEVTRNAEDYRQLSWCPQLEAFDSNVGMRQECYGVEERANQDIVRYGAGAANSPVNNPDLELARACENLARGRSQLWSL
ncbi:hypothetical protein BT93_I0164 [Corymbia citriodora subsp. variegata]|nr:hypothetical protein BT93_I0164 [Corymbia citriodora subsp. variegata]